MQEQCPDHGELIRALESGGLDSDDSPMASHLLSCITCQQVLDNIRLDVSCDGYDLSENGCDTVGPKTSGSTEVGESEWSPDVRARLIRAVADSPRKVGLSGEFPTSLGEYEVIKRIGSGGMGDVFLSRQARLKRDVALKVIKQNRFGRAVRVDRFRQEAESAARLDHPGIVPIYDVGEDGDYLFYSMALMGGGTLATTDEVSASDSSSSGVKKRDFRKAVELVRTLAEAVEYAHQQGVVHRDLKPSNILTDESGRPRVADFGLAKLLTGSDELTAEGDVLGTPAYMAPEQGTRDLGSVTERTDVYGLGAVLYFLLAGRPPFQGNEVRLVIADVINTPPKSLREIDSRIPDDLETIVLKCLSKAPTDRYASARDLADELSRYLAGDPIVARPISRFARLRRRAAKHPFATTLLLACVTLGVVTAGVLSLAGQRGTLLAEAAESLSASRTEADAATRLAEAKSTIARNQAESALRLIEDSVYTVQASFADDPADQQRRRDLLMGRLAELDAIRPELVSELRLLRCRAAANLALAETSMQIEDWSGRTGLSSSRPWFETSIELFRELLEKSPDSSDVKQNLSRALIDYGDALAFADEWTRASDQFQEALPLVQHLVEDDPADLEVQSILADAEYLLGEAYTHIGQRALGYEYLMKSYDRYQPLLKTDENPTDIRSEYFRDLMELGDWYILDKRYDEAKAKYVEMLEIAQQLVEYRPLDNHAHMDLSTAHERLGNVAKAVGEIDIAKHAYERSLEVAIVSAKSAPANELVQWDLSFGYQHMAEISLRSGELNIAASNAHKCADIRRPIIEADPENGHRLRKLLHALKLVAQAEKRRGNLSEAEAAYEDALTFAERLPVHQKGAEIASLTVKRAECRPGDVVEPSN